MSDTTPLFGPFPSLEARFNRLYDALKLIENGCELASEDVWPYLSAIHEVATEALKAERAAREKEEQLV